jgi:membrane associated rhomboid family serine protease
MVVLHVIFPLAVVLLLGLASRNLLRSAQFSIQRQKLLQRPTLSKEEFRGLVEKYGTNSNSFLTLYDGFQYFASGNSNKKGAIAYIDTLRYWVGASEPFSADPLALLDEFAQTAKKLGKGVVLLPIGPALAEKARTVGYGSLMVGSDPTFIFDRYPKDGREWHDMVPTAKQMASKKAVVSEFDPEKLTPEQKEEFDAIIADWLGSRKMDALGFLNKVEPWTLSKHKKYFSIEVKGQITAFIAAIPIWAKNGWYLIDIMRSSNSSAGATELLILETMRLLHAQGAKEVTLGVAPFSNLKNAPDKSRLIYKILNHLYEKGGQFYNFKTLHLFKLKFEPTTTENVFLIHYPPRLSLRLVSSLMEVYLPAGMGRALLSRMARLFSKLSLSGFIKGQLSKTTVVRSAPQSLRRLLWRCKLTLIILVVNFVIYLLVNDDDGILRDEIAQRWGFSWLALRNLHFEILVTSGFLHWNPLHLSFNFFTMILFSGGLEYLTGSALCAFCYFVPMVLTNYLTVLVLSVPIKLVSHELWLKAASEIDVGASVGIFGSAGALSIFLKHAKPYAIILTVYSLAIPFVLNSVLAANHLMAFALGYLVIKVYLRESF